MAKKKKKKRVRKISVHCVLEGESELIFLEFLKEIYLNTDEVAMPAQPATGGTPDSLLKLALKGCDRKRAFLWLDEDLDFDEKSRVDLANQWGLNPKDLIGCPMCEIQSKFNPEFKKPVIIVSSPVCFEGFILKILGLDCPHEQFDTNIREKQIADLKNAIHVIQKDPESYYKANLNVGLIEEKRQIIPELDLIIRMLVK